MTTLRIKAPPWERLETVPSDMRRALPEELGLFLGSSSKPGEKAAPLPTVLPRAEVSRRESGNQEPAEGQGSGVQASTLGLRQPLAGGNSEITTRPLILSMVTMKPRDRQGLA